MVNTTFIQHHPAMIRSNLPPYTKNTVDKSPDICDAVPKWPKSAPTVLNICAKHSVLATTMTQNVKNLPASICSAAMK